ncbi:hypothetical protein [Plantactinospora sp. CA-290183]|uniref:hypothetical protein n=1 Tax=Plantactinospora sp. CA-290183 TaxID=3240006 RepID=UPI003D8F0072
MTFDALVGVFLCGCGECAPDRDHWERMLGEVDTVLRDAGLPAHHEPRSVAGIDPPLGPEDDPCLLGVGLGFYSDRKYQRLAQFAQYVAVHRAAPPDDEFRPEVEEAYDALPDRRVAFDHLIAAVGMETLVLPGRFDRVLAAYGRSDMFCRIASAGRLLTEAVALEYVLRGTDSPVLDRLRGRRLDDLSFAELDARIAADDDTAEQWCNELNLCARLVRLASNVLRSGALAVTG